MHNIKTFEDACEKKGISTDLPDVSTFPPYLRRTVLAFYKLTIIRDAIVGSWAADWKNSNQRKWSPYFWMDAPGFRFGDVDCGIAHTGVTGGSRLCFETEEQARYAGTTFTALYEDLLTGDMMDSLEVQPGQGKIAGILRTTDQPADLRVVAMELAVKAIAVPGRSGALDLFSEADRIYKWLAAAA